MILYKVITEYRRSSTIMDLYYTVRYERYRWIMMPNYSVGLMCFRTYEYAKLFVKGYRKGLPVKIIPVYVDDHDLMPTPSLISMCVNDHLRLGDFQHLLIHKPWIIYCSSKVASVLNNYILLNGLAPPPDGTVCARRVFTLR